MQDPIGLAPSYLAWFKPAHASHAFLETGSPQTPSLPTTFERIVAATLSPCSCSHSRLGVPRPHPTRTPRAIIGFEIEGDPIDTWERSQSRFCIERHRKETYEFTATMRTASARTKAMRASPPAHACAGGPWKRRQAMQTALILSVVRPAEVLARTTPPPPGYRLHRDRLDGYTYLYPKDWLPVTTAGADSFYRNQNNLEENLFVDISSPSSSNYSGVKDLGNEDDIGKRVLDQYLVEFMSTRLGVRRESEVVESTFREAPDGKLYCDVMLRLKSYVNNNQYGITPEERVQYLEWDRILLATLGVANRRLYQLRVQTPTATFLDDVERLQTVRDSFRVMEVEEDEL